MNYIHESPGSVTMPSFGHYNNHSAPQNSVCVDVARVAANAALKLKSIWNPATFRIADFGCATGRNSFLALHDAVAVLLDSSETAVEVIRCDLPSNDFNCLATTLQELVGGCPNSNCFESMIAGSFNQQLFPFRSVHLGICSMALHWIEHFRWNNRSSISPEGSPDEGFARQAWQTQFARFLRHRAEELVEEGMLVFAQLTRHQHETQKHGPFRLLDDALAIVDNCGAVPMSLPIYRATHRDILAMIRETCSDEFEIVSQNESRFVNPHFNEFRRSGRLATFATSYVQFIRGFSERELAIQASGDLDFLDRVYNTMTRLVVDDPFRYEPKNSTSIIQLKRKKTGLPGACR